MRGSPQVGHRYRLLGKLGEGSFGQVWRARDRLLDREVALKAFKRALPGTSLQEMLRQEFLILARLRHPGVPRVYDVALRPRPFFTMEYLRGPDIVTRLRAGPGPIRDGFEEVISAFLSVLAALRYLHARGIVHGDLKPSNILYRTEAPSRGTGEGPVLVDFGLNLPRLRERGVSGTLRYLAPEQIREGAPSAQTDLFSLGVILYEVLTGTSPFADVDPAARAAGRVPRIARLPDRAPAAPPALEEVVVRLLAPDPSMRYREAEEVQRDLLLAAGWDRARVAERLRGDFVFDAGWVGRRQALDELRQAVAAVERSGQGQALALSGAPGSGAGRLVGRLRAEVQASGGVVVTTPCQDRTIPGLLRDLEARLGPASGSDARVEARLRRDLEEALREGDSPHEELGRREVVAERFCRWAAAALGHRATSRRSRGVWVLDGADRLEGPLLDLVRYLVHRAPAFPLLLLLRGDGVGWSGAVGAARAIEIGPLGEDDVAELVRLNLSGLPEPARLAAILRDRTGGNLRRLELLVEELVRSGALRPEPTGWSADLRAVAECPVPRPAGDAGRERLRGLDEEQAGALAAAASFGERFDLDGVATLLGRSGSEVLAVLDNLPAGLVEREASPAGVPAFRFAQAGLVEACAALAGRPRARRLRAAAARCLERRVAAGDETVRERLACLHEAARRWGRAASHFDALAARLRRGLDREGAYRALRRAAAARRRGSLRVPDDATAALADLALATGRPGEALPPARRLARRRPGGEGRARALLRVGIAAQRVGRSGEARRSFEAIQALQESGSPERVHALGRLAQLRSAAGDFEGAASLCEEAVRAAEDLPAAQRHCLALALLRQGEILFARGEPERAEACYRRCVPLCRSGRARALLPAVHLGRGQVLLDRSPSDAVKRLEEAVASARAEADVAVEALAHYHLGIARADLAETDRAREHYLRAWEVFSFGSRWDLARTEAQLGNLARETGDFRQAEAHYGRFAELAAGMPPAHPSHRLNRLNRWRLEADRDKGDEVLPALRESERDFGEDHPRSHRSYLFMRAELERRHGQPRDAERFAARLLEDSRRGHDRYFEATAARLLGDLAAAAGRALEARDHLLRAQGLARDLGDAILQADVDLSMAALAVGHPQIGVDPRPALDRARATFLRGRLRPRLERAAALASRPEAPAAPAAARQRKELAALYRASEAIRSAGSLDELLDKLLEGAIDLMGAERGVVFLVREGSRQLDLCASRGADSDTRRDAGQISRSILSRSLEASQPILSTNAMLDERFRNNRSVVNYGIRSFLCAPLLLPDRAIGTLYVDHRNVENLFQDADGRFLMAYAGFAAAAIEAALQARHLRRRIARLQTEVRGSWHPGAIIGDSPAMRRVFDLVRRVGPRESTIMIRGESGTGKELAARLLHEHSSRRDGPFVPVNCAALPGPLVESELFGVVRGAATDVTERAGKFEEAHGGTLFLDEVGDLALEAQAKILRAIQERRVERVGSHRSTRLDLRLIAATHADLEAAIRQGTFREDLYYRVNVIEIRLPALRERREDIPALVRHYVDWFCREQNRPVLGISEEVLDAYRAHDWPGNIRELRNAVERAVLLAEDDWLPPLDRAQPGEEARAVVDLREAFAQGLSEQDVKRTYARYVYDRLRSKRRACQVLEINFKTLLSRLN